MPKQDEGHRYDDIINLPHHVSETRPHMSMHDRAAQFSPFAALSGYDDAVKETARLTEQRIELGEDEAQKLAQRLNLLQNRLREMPDSGAPEVNITYFVADERKAGGKYVTVNGAVMKIDTYARTLTLADGTKIPIDEIINLDGEIFNAAL